VHKYSKRLVPNQIFVKIYPVPPLPVRWLPFDRTTEYISPQYSWSLDQGIRSHLLAVLIDEVHFVHDWADFRPYFDHDYLHEFHTLGSKTLKVVQSTDGFKYCPISKTCIKRPRDQHTYTVYRGKSNSFRRSQAILFRDSNRSIFLFPKRCSSSVAKRRSKVSRIFGSQNGSKASMAIWSTSIRSK